MDIVDSYGILSFSLFHLCETYQSNTKKTIYTYNLMIEKRKKKKEKRKNLILYW